MCSYIVPALAAILMATSSQPLRAALPGKHGDSQVNGRILAQISADLAPGKASATLICLGGFQFAVGAILGHGASSGPAVSLIQVYKNSEGNNQPATCTKR